MLMGSFKPIFVADEQLKAELGLLRDILKSRQLTDREISEQMYNHIVAVYGKTDENMLRLWLSEYLKM
jgi:DNA polymerase III psi subunit